jgi:hypothetical protein
MYNEKNREAIMLIKLLMIDEMMQQTFANGRVKNQLCSSSGNEESEVALAAKFKAKGKPCKHTDG